ncbi:MAG: hypothetical protein ACKVW3_06040 [Phycisphaerales bacterium]
MVALAAILGLCERAGAQAGCIVGWGDGVTAGTNLFLIPPTGTDYVEIAAGFKFCIARRSNGRLVGWGTNAQGQASPPLGSFVAISAGFSHAMALAADGKVSVWGSVGPNGELLPPAGLEATAIAAGENWCVAIQTNGRLMRGATRCW